MAYTSENKGNNKQVMLDFSGISVKISRLASATLSTSRSGQTLKAAAPRPSTSLRAATP